MLSFGEVLDRYKGFGPGFDFARVFLAFSVLIWHCLLLATGGYGAPLESPLWVHNYSILPMFFGLSGFLVAGSAQRLSLANFALNRGLRIFPALIVEIGLSALILGPIFTVLPLKQYFSASEFYSYFLNIISIIHYRLPGVFADNPNEFTINGSLWTVPFEFICYFVMGFIIVRRWINSGTMLIASAIFVVCASVALQIASKIFPDAKLLKDILGFYLHAGKGPALLPCFLLGAAVYVLRYKIPFSWPIFIACIAVVTLFGIFTDRSIWRWTPVVMLVAPTLIYIVCFIGLLKIPRIPFFWRGDYSYGIYLYGYPIQQALVASSDIFRNPLWMIVGSCILTTAFATFSWHVIEKPILKQRKKFSFSANHHAEREKIEDVDASPPSPLPDRAG